MNTTWAVLITTEPVVTGTDCVHDVGVGDMRNDFYEDDEPVEDVLAAFEAGEEGVTAPPPRLWFPESIMSVSVNRTCGFLASSHVTQASPEPQHFHYVG